MIKRNTAISIVLLGSLGIFLIWQRSKEGDVGAYPDLTRDIPTVGLDSTRHHSNPKYTKTTPDKAPLKLGGSKAVVGPRRYVDVTESVNQKEPHTEEGSYDMYDVETEQLQRKARLDEACNRLGMSRDLPPISWEKTVHFIASDKFKFIFCFVPKISCTTWKDVMTTLYRSDHRPLQTVPTKIRGVPLKRKGRFLKMSDIKDASKVMQRWKTYAKVVFTREPLERVLSAYLDKFVYGKQTWERQFGGTIVKKYRRPNGSKIKFPLKDKIRFDEFIRFITDNGRKAKMTQQTDHWLPLSRIASPCRMKYDFIGHYETLKYDAPYVINRFNLSRHVTFPEVHSSRSHEKLINAYKEIPRDLIYRLVDYYKDDYDLFGYSVNKTLDIIFNGRTKETSHAVL